MKYWNRWFRDDLVGWQTADALRLLKAKEYTGGPRPSTTKHKKPKDLHDPTTTKTKNPRRIGPTG